MKTPTRLLAVIVAVLAAGAVALAQEPLNVLQVNYTRTHLNKATGETTVIEQGSYLLAPDGRQRIEHNKSGTRSVEIFDSVKDQRITIDPATKHATVSSMHALPPSAPAITPFTKDTAPQTQSTHESLGTKAVGGLILQGSRQTLILTTVNGAQVRFVFESWFYRFGSLKVLPAQLEERIEDDNEVTERKITDVSTVVGSEALFNVPAGFAVR